MPLEASIVLLDNSEFAINSDYGNTRWDSQLDATKVIFNAKTGSNPESSVGLMTIAGSRSALVGLLATTLTADEWIPDGLTAPACWYHLQTSMARLLLR